MKTLDTDVLVVGAGPAGLVVSRLLLEQGIQVTLIDRQWNFDKEFRGEYIQAGVVKLLKQLELFEEIEKVAIPIKHYRIYDHGKVALKLDFSGDLGVDVRQSLVLPLLLEKCQKYPNFRFFPQKLISLNYDEYGQVIGGNTSDENDETFIRSKLIIGADGRNSTVRKLCQFPLEDKSFSLDMFWLKIDKPKNFAEFTTEIRLFEGGFTVINPSYPDSLRIGITFQKGTATELRERYQNAKEFANYLVNLIPEAKKEIEQAVVDWNSFIPLSVSGSIAKKWSKDRIVLIGDAAHTVGPFAGQGINQAIKDALVLSKIIDKSGLEEINDEILDCLRKNRSKEIEDIQKFQLSQENLMKLKGIHGRIARKIVYTKVMRQSSKKAGLVSRLTFRDMKR